MPGAPNPLAPGMGPQVVNRRMNAIKTNHPKDMIGPNMGKFNHNDNEKINVHNIEAVNTTLIEHKC